jgi:2-C-methyl-D-erythritol 2,4-cyclodiphosphate synthase
MRSGIGYDVHRFGEGRKLVLGGVEIEGERGLLGHSDADVVAHAVMDALLGALGKGDIGDRFPDSDPSFENADSVELLGQIVRELAGWSVANVDVTVIAERPHLGPYKQRMAERLAGAMQVDSSCVNVKATTNEGMGFIGRAEGIATLAIAHLERDA